MNKAEIEIYATSELKKLRDFCVAEFDLGNDWGVNLTFKHRSSGSCGGTTGITRTPMIEFGTKIINGVPFFPEYKSYEHDSEIGAVADVTDEEKITLLLAHEIAHCVQYSIEHSGSKLRQSAGRFEGLGTVDDGHGRFFRSIYRIIRKKMVNPALVGKPIGRSAVGLKATFYVANNTSHELIGKKFVHPQFGASEIIDYKPRNHKYPIIFRHALGLTKVSVERAQNYVASAA